MSALLSWIQHAKCVDNVKIARHASLHKIDRPPPLAFMLVPLKDAESRAFDDGVVCNLDEVCVVDIEAVFQRMSDPVL